MMSRWNIKQQSSRGSTLIIALVFLLVLTIAGITAMRFSSMSENMAGNSQSRNYVFQQVASEINLNLNAFTKQSEMQPLLSAQHAAAELSDEDKKVLPDTARKPIDVDRRLDKYITDKNKLRYLSEGLCSSGSSVEEFVCIAYELDVTATLDNGAASQQVQGFVVERLK